MEIVIKIPEEEYQKIINHTKEILDESSFIEPKYLYRAVIDGTPLPEHHGDLIDRDDIEVLRIGNIEEEYDKGFDAGVNCMVNRILDAPTIIEAEEE